MARHVLYAVEVGYTSPELIGGITALRLPTDTDILGEALDSEPYVRTQSVAAQRFNPAFTTRAINQAMLAPSDGAGITVLGLPIDADTGTPTTVPPYLSLYAQQLALGGTRKSGANHRKHTIANGLIVPRTINVAHQANAELSCEVFPIWDGTNVPFVIAENQSLPAGIAATDRFTLGKVTLAGTVVTGVKGIDIDFGLAVSSEGSDSEVWDREVSIMTVTPIITFRGVNLSWIGPSAIPVAKLTAGLPDIGKAGTHANTIFYLRKRAAGATFVADATVEHLKFTAAGILHAETALDAAGQDTGEVNVRMVCNYDGTNAPIKVVESAIA